MRQHRLPKSKRRNRKIMRTVLKRKRKTSSELVLKFIKPKRRSKTKRLKVFKLKRINKKK